MPPEPDKLTKQTIALTQLHRAVLLVDGDGHDFDPISALTLAGAAEEILGKMVQIKGFPTAFEDDVVAGSLFWDLVIVYGGQKGRTYTKPSEKEIGHGINSTRNEFKHNDGGKNGEIETYVLIEAQKMIHRALRNYERVYGELPTEKAIRDYCEGESF